MDSIHDGLQFVVSIYINRRRSPPLIDSYALLVTRLANLEGKNSNGLLPSSPTYQD